MSTVSLNNLAEQMRQICEKHHVVGVRLFGSTAHGTNRPDSDADLLVDFESNYVPTFFSLGKLEEEQSPLFDGRPIDLIRPTLVHSSLNVGIGAYLI